METSKRTLVVRSLQAYVILSRLQSAEGLLLMRAFSPMLFQQGEAPGPHVLLKFLRSQRSKSHSGSSTYSFADALDEYKHRMEDVKKNQALRREQGPSLKCWCCGLDFPAGGFDAKFTSKAEFYEQCLAPGHWRCCTACREALLVNREMEEETSKTKCQTCARFWSLLKTICLF